MELMDLSENNLTSLEWSNETYSDYYDLDIDNDTIVNKSAVAAASDNNYGYPMVQAVLDFINLYYLGALIIVGLLGNGKNVVAFILNRNEMSSPSYYLASLALADVVFLITILFLWLGKFKIQLFTQAGFYQTLFYLSSVSSCVSAWMVAAFTFERLIVVRYPLKRVKICTVRRAKIIIFCLTAGAFIFQLISLFPTGVINKKGKGTHASRLPFYYEMMRILSMLETAYTLVIPPVIIVLLNGFIIHDLFQFNRTFNAGGNKHRATASSISRTPAQCHQRNEDVKMRKLTYCRDTQKRKQQQQDLKNDTNYFEMKNDEGLQQNDIAPPATSADENASDANTDATYVKTLAVVENTPYRQISTPPSISPMSSSPRGHRQQQSLLSNKVPVTDETLIIAESVLAASRPEISSVARNEMRHIRKDDGIIRNRPALMMDMEAIEMDTLSPASPSVMDETAAQITNTISPNIDAEQQPPNSILMRIRQLVKSRLKTSLAINESTSRTSTEYTITKKLVLISTVHVLLNLPSYTLNLKHFIDETISSSSNGQMSWTMWYLQQFSMVLYNTSFSINFLLYPNSSNSFNLNFKFFIRCCWRRSRQNDTENRHTAVLMTV